MKTKRVTKKKVKTDTLKTIRVGKGDKLLMYFPDLDDYEELLRIKANASKVFGQDNVLVVMGNMKVTKVQDL